MAFEGQCTCADCTAARGEQSGAHFRWPDLDDAALQSKLTEYEPMLGTAEGSDFEPMLTDCDQDRAVLIVASVTRELSRRSAGDMPAEIIWRRGRAMFVDKCREARYAAQRWEFSTAQEAIDHAAMLADENPLITVDDIDANLQPAMRVLEREQINAREATL